ncbi:MAG: hypothetical protein AAF694_04465 [Bacteroidota bacterium]
MYKLNLRSIYSILLILALGCGSDDIALINKVKRFEPQWMNLSEQVTYIEQKLSITRRRYPKDLEAIEPQMRSVSASRQTEVFGLRSQYRNLMADRENLEKRFAKELERLQKEVEDFNEWVNTLMKGKFDPGVADKRLRDFQKTHSLVKMEMDDIEKSVVKNIQEHNSVMKQLGQQLRIYNNFDIAVR